MNKTHIGVEEINESSECVVDVDYQRCVGITKFKLVSNDHPPPAPDS